MLRHSRMLELGSPAPDFMLPDGEGRLHGLAELLAGRGLVVAFLCNHCPFVGHIASSFARAAKEHAARGIHTVAISSNDILAHPEDSPALMVQFARQHGFTFPYLYDESQQVALAYEAICTPDLFLFDAKGYLFYRGQFDGSRPYTEWDVKFDKPRNTVPCDGADLRRACDSLLAGQPPPADQKPGAGCSLKWKPENEPDWA
jgi:peroxiredoxin